MNYKISIDSIIDVDWTQIREAYDNGVIADLSLMFAEPPENCEIDEADYYPPELPPISVVPAPGDDSKYWIIDGHHRYKAAKATGKRMILADIRDGVKDLDALRYLQANCNGEAVANRTIETRRRQVKAAIKAEPKWYPFQIARYCHVSVDLVHSVFAELEAQKPKKPIEKAREALSKPGSGGKSNRQLAKEAGVDEGTIRKAKEEVRKYSEPKNSAPEKTPEPAIDAQLDKVAAKARESVEWKPTREETPYCIRLRDCNNIEKIVDDVLEWLGDRAEIFAVLLRERLDG